MAKTKRLKTVRAGRLVFAACYMQVRPGDSQRARAAKSKCSSLARQRLNFRYAWQKLRLLLAANFGRGDLWVTLTYDDEHLPPSRKEAKRQVTAFLDRLRYARRRQGVELKYCYSTHEMLEDGSRRLHHHMVLNASGDGRDIALIRRLWAGGSNIEVMQLGKAEMYRNDDMLELAQYMLHERNPEATEHATGDRGWCSSRNLIKPEVTSELVDEADSIEIPQGAYVLDSESRTNEFGAFEYVCYLLPKTKDGLILSVSG